MTTPSGPMWWQPTEGETWTEHLARLNADPRSDTPEKRGRLLAGPLFPLVHPPPPGDDSDEQRAQRAKAGQTKDEQIKAAEAKAKGKK